MKSTSFLFQRSVQLFVAFWSFEQSLEPGEMFSICLYNLKWASVAMAELRGVALGWGGAISGRDRRGCTFLTSYLPTLPSSMPSKLTFLLKPLTPRSYPILLSHQDAPWSTARQVQILTSRSTHLQVISEIMSKLELHSTLYKCDKYDEVLMYLLSWIKDSH